MSRWLTNRVDIEQYLRRHDLVPLKDSLYATAASFFADAAERMHEGGVCREVSVDGPGLDLGWPLGQLSDDIGDISHW